MKKKSIFKIVVPIILLLILAGVLVSSTLMNPQTVKPEPTVATETELESIAAYNAEQALQLINANIEQQLTAEEINELSATTDSISGTTDAGEPVKTALIAIETLPADFNVEENAKFVQNFIEETTEGNPWEFKEANKEEFDPNSGVIKSIITWETGKNPVNPGILTFTWVELKKDNTVTGYEIHIQAEAS